MTRVRSRRPVRARVLGALLLGMLVVGAPFMGAPVAGAQVPVAPPNAAPALQIYFIDVEGGQATLIRTPAGESFLIDAGFPGDGTFESRPGSPATARDAQRILKAARDAGITRIDHLMLTHYHADHSGGVIELAQLLPIRHFIDHAAPSAEAETAVPGTQAMYDAYVALRSTGTHTEPRPGDRLAIGGVEVTVVASAGAVLAAPLPGAGQANSACGSGGVPAQEKTENPRSTGVLLQYGKFRFLDVGDLSGAPLHALTCPTNLIGSADLYLIAHHGGADGADPALFSAVKPRAVVFNNGARKGGQAPTFATITQMAGMDGWQLHQSLNRGVENLPSERIANLDESTSHWIKVTAQANGSFTVTNGRTGATTAYPR